MHSTCQADTAQVASATATSYGLSRGLLGLKWPNKYFWFWFWCRSAYSIFYWQNDTAIVISLQHASNCIKNTIILLSLVYIKLVVYYNKRSRKSRGIADLKRNPWNSKKKFFFFTESFARHNLRQPVTMTGWRVARIDVASLPYGTLQVSEITWIVSTPLCWLPSISSQGNGFCSLGVRLMTHHFLSSTMMYYWLHFHLSPRCNMLVGLVFLPL